MEIAKITSKGQVTIPVGIRNKLGVDTGDQLIFLEKNGVVIIVKADNLDAMTRYQRYLEEFQKYEK
ncbi:MAG: AbrB/MazE/SpoVT family DNA-binding domain-containing protein [Butyrivibrio sp.]|nr:AbrB/MazE/SpoVT family DNA-binding domain-containing protein [Butyrivibrio sp.]MBP3240490.1 AbrB/MazE/SpoVT family DNA-binding domain-containing protein [Oribacterium sp.]